MANPVFYFRFDMPGAPSLTGSAGSLINLLQKCLVDGFNTQTVTNFTVSQNVASIFITNAHQYFEKEQMIKISGNSTVNGLYRVAQVTTTYVSVNVPNLTDGTYYTAGMSCMVAPIGWNMPFGTSGNIGVFRSSDATGTQYYLRVDDTNAPYATMLGYRTMYDLNTGSDVFPSETTKAFAYNSLCYWRKAYNSGTTPIQWVLIGDSKTFYFGNAPGQDGSQNAGLYGTIHTPSSANQPRIEWQMFGDIASIMIADTSNCVVSGLANGGNISYVWSGSRLFTNGSGTSSPPQTVFIGKSFSNQNVGPYVGFQGDRGGYTSNETFGAFGVSFPNGTNGGIELRGNIGVIEFDGYNNPQLFKRGYLRGVYQPKHKCPMNSFDRFPLPNGNTGIFLRATDPSYNGSIVFDLYGPW